MQSDARGAGNVIPVADLRDYFRESVDAAIANQQVQVDQHTVCYVVNLLTLYARSDQLYEDRGDYFGLPPLAILLKDAADAERDDLRSAALQRLGDVALFIAGCFADSLQQKLVDLDYYIHMGGGAYSSLSSELRGTARGRALAGVFGELAVKFQHLVDVLNEVSEAAGSSSDRDILRLYEVWQKTGSARAERLLRQHDIVPIDVNLNRRH
ncbi:MAG: hypothetical protein AAFX58_06410 [Pseudomonadota bacterium]